MTSGIAAPAYAGIPVTHREAASSVAFITGHEDPGKRRVGARLAGACGFPRHADRLHGRAPARGDRRPADRRRTPGRRAGRASSPRDASRTSGRRWGRLRRSRRSPPTSRSSRRRSRSSVRSRRCRRSSRWLEHRPLHGVTVAVTRAREQASRLAERLRGLGADVVVAPVIRTDTLPGPVPELDGYDLICFTSPNGVEALFERLRRRRPRHARVPEPHQHAHRRDRARDRAGAASARDRRRRDAGQGCRRGARRGARRASR